MVTDFLFMRALPKSLKQHVIPIDCSMVIKLNALFFITAVKTIWPKNEFFQC